MRTVFQHTVKQNFLSCPQMTHTKRISTIDKQGFEMKCLLLGLQAPREHKEGEDKSLLFFPVIMGQLTDRGCAFWYFKAVYLSRQLLKSEMLNKPLPNFDASMSVGT